MVTVPVSVTRFVMSNIANEWWARAGTAPTRTRPADSTPAQTTRLIPIPFSAQRRAAVSHENRNIRRFSDLKSPIQRRLEHRQRIDERTRAARRAQRRDAEHEGVSV